VKLISDTEKAKSSGLLNRLLEEGDRPQCDVFLSEDPVRSAVLKKRGLSAPYQSPAAQGLRPEFSDPTTTGLACPPVSGSCSST